MIQLFRSLLGGSIPQRPNEPKPKTGIKQTPAGGDYRAVSLEPCPECRAAARDAPGKRFLLREAPKLPLMNCTRPASCRCRFRKHADRRDDDRRLLGESQTARWLPTADRRTRRSRRSVRN